MLIFCLIFDQFQSGVAHKSNTYKKACHQPYSGISRTLSNPGTFRTLVYIQNSGTFRTRGKCRTLAYSEPYQVSTIEFLRKYLKAIVLQIRIIFAISAFHVLCLWNKYHDFFFNTGLFFTLEVFIRCKKRWGFVGSWILIYSYWLIDILWE